jgi:hypothetical protein
MISYVLVVIASFAKLCCVRVCRKLVYLVQDVNAQPEKYVQADSNM